MIFVTVGTQLPFDRLLKAVDHWARSHPDQRVVAQTGKSCTDSEKFETRSFMDAGEFKSLASQCDVLVAHAGMGSILTAIELGKQVIVMPRRVDLGEHRNDHQKATAERLAHLKNLQVVENLGELTEALAQALAAQPFALVGNTISEGHRQLVNEIRSFISPPAVGASLESGIG